MAERDLLVRILGDDRDLQRALRNTETSVAAIDKRTAAFGSNIKTAFATAGISLGTATIFAELSNSIDAASALNEEVSKSEQIFGDSADSIREWSETTAQSFGISQRAALEATGIFGNLFRVVNIAPAQAAELSRSLVELAADLASFNNADPSDVLQALRSGLIGEVEPLRRYGVLLSEARVQQVALAATGKDNAKQLTNQEKALARYNIILQDTAPAQGDFARTSQNLANQQRILRAQVEDLEASVGTLLIPKLTDLVTTLNDVTGAAVDLADALVALKDLAPIEIPIDLPIAVDIIFAGRSTGGAKDLAGRIANQVHDAVASGLSAGTEPFKNLERLFRGERGRGFTLFPAPVDTRGTSTRDAADRAQNEADKAVDEAKRAAAAQTRAQKAWDEFVKGMGLKLDRAGLTDSLDDDIAALRELESAILRRIDREGRTFTLVEQLTNTRRQLKTLVDRRATDAKQAGEDAFNATVDALSLKVDAARATASLADDQRALRALEQAIVNRIASEGESTDLLRQLFNVRQEKKAVADQLSNQQLDALELAVDTAGATRSLVDDRRALRQLEQELLRRIEAEGETTELIRRLFEVRQDQADVAKRLRQAQQFQKLGLTDEGQERAPSAASLRRRRRSLEEEIKGTSLDTKQNRQILRNAARVLSGQFGEAGREVRLAIEGMFDEIAAGFERGNRTVGPLTKTTSLNTKKFLDGLGLSAEELNALRGRLSSFNSAGVAPAGFLSRGFNAPSGGGFADPTVNVVVESTVTLDGEKVGKSVTRHQQKARRRNPRQKRGPNRRGGEG